MYAGQWLGIKAWYLSGLYNDSSRVGTSGDLAAGIGLLVPKPVHSRIEFMPEDSVDNGWCGWPPLKLTSVGTGVRTNRQADAVLLKEPQHRSDATATLEFSEDQPHDALRLFVRIKAQATRRQFDVPDRRR